MATRIRQRSVYPTTKQKRKLIAFVAQHPQLISFRASQDFSKSDSQKLWNTIATECNALPGARKTWRQWKKTWQDLKSKVKKRQQVRNGDIPSSIDVLTKSEKEALGLKNVSSTTSYQENVEFVVPDEENTEDNNLNGYNDLASFSDPESPPESKVEAFIVAPKSMKNISSINSQTHSDSCVFNCDRLAIQEQRKIEIKEDYFNFKKDYLRQKLLLMKEQTEALKGIAKGLAK